MSPEAGHKTSVASFVLRNALNMKKRTLLDEDQMFWKRYLTSLLPSQNQCDFLVSLFFENINWIYQTVHAPSFRSEYSTFWSSCLEDIDLIWLSLLFIMLALSATAIPSAMAESAGLEPAELAPLADRLYSASRHALHAGSYDLKPCLTQIQVFSVSQTYWYAMKNIEALNSHLGQALRNAQALGLDKESPATVTNQVEREMRHRLWWDLMSTDTFQAMCLGRQTLAQCHQSSVPFPSNCHDIDISPTSINVQPLSEPTEMSCHVFRARIFKVLNKLFIDNGSQLSSYTFISKIDAEITAIMDEFPWYFQSSAEDCRPWPATLPPTFGFLPWQVHLLQNCIMIQRIRMYRQFLHPLMGDSLSRCMAAASSALSTYKVIRSQDTGRLQLSNKTRMQIYQIVSTALVLGTFLLVEQPLNSSSIRADIEMVRDDLCAIQAHYAPNSIRAVPLLTDGLKLLYRILALYDARCRSEGMECSADAPTSLAQGISTVFGGEVSARRYLERCTVEYIMNDDESRSIGTTAEPSHATLSAEFQLGTIIDSSVWDEAGDTFWADLEWPL